MHNMKRDRNNDIAPCLSYAYIYFPLGKRKEDDWYAYMYIKNIYKIIIIFQLFECKTKKKKKNVLSYSL